MKCMNDMQCKSYKKKKKKKKNKQTKPKQNKRRMVTKNIKMKHKDHVRKTQLN